MVERDMDFMFLWQERQRSPTRSLHALTLEILFLPLEYKVHISAAFWEPTLFAVIGPRAFWAPHFLGSALKYKNNFKKPRKEQARGPQKRGARGICQFCHMVNPGLSPHHREISFILGINAQLI